MTELPDSDKREIEDAIEKTLSRGRAFMEGVETEFWRQLIEMLDEDAQRSLKSLASVDPDDRARICSLQLDIKLPGFLKAKVDSWIEEARAILQ